MKLFLNICYNVVERGGIFLKSITVNNSITSSNISITKERNVGIEALRLLSMWMVVVLHCLGHGGILNNLVEFSPNSCIAWLLEIACLGAVNIYALITGYVYINSKHKYSKFLSLWLSVFFYSFFITLIYKFITPNDISITTLIKSTLPIMTKQYWYFSSYFCLFVFIPFINILIKNLSKKQHKFLIYCIIFCFCVLNFASTILGLDIFNLNGGYSFLWLMSLYIIGAYLKLYENDFNKYNKNKFLYAYILSVCITFLLRFLSKCIKFKLLGIFSNSGGMFISYTSPFILLGLNSKILPEK